MNLRDAADEARSLPPHDAGAERAIVAAILKRPSRLAALNLEIEDFYDARCRAIFAACLALHRRGEPVEYVTALDELRAMGHEDGHRWLADVDLGADSRPYAGFEDRGYTRQEPAGAWAVPIEDAARRRRVLDAVARIAEDAWSRRPFDAPAAVDALAAATRPRQVATVAIVAPSIASLFDDDEDEA